MTEEGLGGRLLAAWRRTVSLSAPIAVQQTFNTLMRTVDIVVTGLFSPAAVAAVGLADLYAQVPLRLGLALGTGAIALSSQDTGRGDAVARDRAITQALLMGLLVGLPLVLVAVTVSPQLVGVLGAEPAVVEAGSAYLALVLAVAPMRIVGLVGARSLQGTGDTVTPMAVNIVANLLNIAITVGTGLGLGPLPRLGMVGVGLGTAVSRTLEAVLITAAIRSPLTDLSFARPRSLTITRQLVAVSLPNFAEGMSTSVANFPFNSLLLLFGTEVTAAYHIGRRVYQQFTGPLYRSYSTAASIVVGQALGEGDPTEARFSGVAITALSVLTLGVAGVVLFAGAEPIADLFTNDPPTLAYAVAFTRVFAVSMVFFGLFFPLAGGLRGAGDTRTPFYARFTGTFGFMLGFGYVVGVRLDYGLPGVYAGIVLSYAWWALVVVVGFRWGDWADTAAEMVAERADAADSN
ncbi:MATE family efflux transporter [Candidatus Halobonum tyrrellensis]|uniref:Multidrug-efflux transporter n=1 Tax=Candidatus Halobonum tyrrellensis G22 TaxID=1324957 RepID=V4HH02_9EURY|nr:MATE family efflux transporter [Candidatus Halobonum tyrrellensis]ESP90000.1 MATE efflux family protein [Candidatus Halobonum tyrrellensis G22]